MLTLFCYLLILIFWPIPFFGKKFGKFPVYTGFALGFLWILYNGNSLPGFITQTFVGKVILRSLVGLNTPLSKAVSFLANGLFKFVFGYPVAWLSNAHWILKILMFLPLCYVILFFVFLGAFAGAPELMTLVIAGYVLYKKKSAPLSLSASRRSIENEYTKNADGDLSGVLGPDRMTFGL